MAMTRFCTVLLLLVSLMSCSKDGAGDIYPVIISELCTAETNGQGALVRLHLDDGSILSISGSTPTEYAPDAFYRTLASYTPVSEQVVSLRSIYPALVLTDSTECAERLSAEGISTSDPVVFVSGWRTAQFLNLHLATKTQNMGRHYWGYTVEERTERHIRLRLYHRQMSDPASFTEQTYASIQTKNIPYYEEGDTVSIRIRTWDGKDYALVCPSPRIIHL